MSSSPMHIITFKFMHLADIIKAISSCFEQIANAVVVHAVTGASQ